MLPSCICHRSITCAGDFPFWVASWLIVSSPRRPDPHTIHLSAITQIRYRHSGGRDYYDRKLAGGATGDRFEPQEPRC
jgi:hypothetical protein